MTKLPFTMAGTVLIAVACSRRTQPSPDAGAAVSAPLPPNAGESVVPGDLEIRPVYPTDAGPADPTAQRLCDALHEVAAKREAECCASTPGFRATSECVRTLSFSLASKTVTLDPAAVDACTAAVAKAHDGCGWVGPRGQAALLECQGIVKGTLPRGEKCRSSHECRVGLSCLNVGATRMGVCSPPRPARHPCKLAADPLGGYLSDDTIDLEHPECAGYCVSRVCADVKPDGGSCRVAAECGANHACVTGKCVASPLPKAGEPCPGSECTKGLACISGKCATPRLEGEPCGSDVECYGLCDKGGTKKDAGAEGRCVKRCPGTLPPRR